jgi:hypothetical protein
MEEWRLSLAPSVIDSHGITWKTRKEDGIFRVFPCDSVAIWASSRIRRVKPVPFNDGPLSRRHRSQAYPNESLGRRSPADVAEVHQIGRRDAASGRCFSRQDFHSAA